MYVQSNCEYERIMIIILYKHVSDSNWGVGDAWSNAPQLLSDNYFVVS